MNVFFCPVFISRILKISGNFLRRKAALDMFILGAFLPKFPGLSKTIPVFNIYPVLKRFSFLN